MPKFARRATTALITLVAVLGLTVADGHNGLLAEPFDRDWTVTTSIGAAGEQAYAVVVQPDGKYVLGGYTETGGVDRDFALARYNVDGTLDQQFGQLGGPAGTWRTITDLAVDSNGRIVAVGNAIVNNNYDVIVARYLGDGTLDPNFGYIMVDSGGTDVAFAVDVLPSNKILVAGYRSNGGVYEATAMRFNSDGSLDGSFGTFGIAVHPLPGGSASTRAMTVDHQGRIVLAGFGEVGGQYKFLVARLLSDGSLDGSFGTGGFFTSLAGQFEGMAMSIVEQSSGRLVIAGHTEFVSPRNLILMGLRPNGTLDPAFGVSGITTLAFGNYDLQGSSLGIDGASRLVLGGYVQRPGSNYDFIINRFSSDGILDTSFGDGASIIQQLGASADFLWDMVILPDGRILGAGSSYQNGGYDFALTRYTPRPQISLPIWRATLDPNGGTCADNTPRTATWTSVFVGYRYLPGPTDCSRPGHVFAGWADTTTPTVARTFPLLTDPSSNTQRYFVAENVDLTAIWKPLPTAVPELVVFANFFCGPCTNAWLIHSPSEHATNYDYTLDNMPITCTTDIAVFGLRACELTGLPHSTPLTATVTPRNTHGNGPIANATFTLSP